ncbi:MAG: AAA family ATPase, partial [Actinobacteria bacterium]|nr:AAA family ATPase [Actinomycetota bacterium]
MFVGRAAERAEIDRILAGAHGGRSGTVLLVGDPGVGKTALLEDAVARAGDFCVVRAGGFETEAGLAFAGLDALVRPFASRIDSLPPPQAAALAGALALGPPAPGDRFTVSVAALSLFAGAAEERPLLLVVDDAQWLDPASLDCLAFVARRLTAEAIGLLVGARDVPPAALQRTRGIAVLRIEGLPEAEAVQLVRSHAPTAVADHVATKLAGETAGNPLALIETTAALSTDQLAGVTPLPDVFSAGPGMTRALLSHLLPLSPVCRRALVIAAAGSGAPALISSALRDAGIDDALLEAEAADIVTIGAEGILFRHPLLRAATYAAASGPERRAAHAALADAAGALGDPGVEERARHLAAATDGPDDDVAAVVEEAGRRAAARMGYAEAAEAMRRAAQLTTVNSSRAPRLLEASMFAMMAGRAGLARDCLDQAVREAGDPVIAATASVARAHLEMMTGDVERARDMLVGEAERPGVDRAVSASLLAEAAHAAGMAGDAEGGTLARASEARLPDDAPAAVRTQVDITVAVWAVLRGDPDWAERMDRVTDPMSAVAPGDPLGWARVAMFLNPLVAVGSFSAARELADRLIGIGRALSAPSLLPYPLAMRGHLLTATGDWDGALTDADEARRLAEQTGQRSVAAFAACVLARVLAARGDENACRTIVRAIQDGVADAAGDS